jgi:hypothetical protein
METEMRTDEAPDVDFVKPQTQTTGTGPRMLQRTLIFLVQCSNLLGVGTTLGHHPRF